jgi:transcriptional regulator with XRE-family HTH domain
MQVSLPTIMTHARLSAILTTLGWSSAELGRRLNIGERSVRRWLSGQQEIPDRVGDWLEAVVQAMQTAPPPPERT